MTGEGNESFIRCTHLDDFYCLVTIFSNQPFISLSKINIYTVTRPILTEEPTYRSPYSSFHLHSH